MKEFVEKRLKLKRKVLVVDDEHVDRVMLQKILENDYEVLLAENGREAMDIIRKYHDTLSLVLLDLIMPEMDGYEVLHEMQIDDTLSIIPVIVLTADEQAEVKSLNLGAADFITKPYDVSEVIRLRIGRTIQLYESRNLISATKTDRLTGLFQREYFMNYVEVADHYDPDQARDIIVLNINRFHLINEIHGREYGDHVLVKVGKCIKQYMEEIRGVACRNNSDCFYLYIPHQEDPEELLLRLQVNLEDAVEDAKNRFRLGIYTNVDKHLDIEKRFDCGLLACNSIKDNYKKFIAYYDKEIHEKEAYEERLIMDMDRALEEEQFEVYYQPKFAIQGKEVTLASAEALVRWQHPEYGMISPGVFIELFERKGLLQKLDHFVWIRVAKQIAKWKTEYGRTIPVSVNVSRIDLLERTFVDDICGIVKDAGITTAEYYLEITESAYTEDPEEIISVVKRLRELGFRIEIDDFGTGYSSLNMISSVPFDVLKLDIGFVRHVHESPMNLKMVGIIMEIAELLKVKVVAEGVEVKEQYEHLKNLGVDIVQGFYFSKPLPTIDFERIIRGESANG